MFLIRKMEQLKVKCSVDLQHKYIRPRVHDHDAVHAVKNYLKLSTKLGTVYLAHTTHELNMK